MWGIDHSRHHDSIKLLKNGAEKGFIFHAIIPVLYPLKILLVKLKSYPMLSMLESQS